MERNIPITEQEYPVRFYEEVLPYLETRRKGDFFEPEPGVPIWYENYDTEEPNPRGIMLMLHGYIETLPKYYEVVYYFLKAGFHVRQLQLRGHGKSYRHVDDPYLLHIPDYRLFLRDIDRYVHRVVLPQNDAGLPLYLYGHSMGGALGGLFLAKRPGLIPKAVLSSPMMEIKHPRPVARVERPLLNAASHTPLAARYAPGMKPYDGKWSFEHSLIGVDCRFRYTAEYIDADEAHQTWAASWQTVRELFKITDVVRDPKICERITAEVLVFSAEKDVLVSRRGQMEFVSRVENACLVDIPDAKHEIYSAPDEPLWEYWEELFDFFGIDDRKD
ncbi:MAG: alpha/beta hydrolase [Lachnospiraceae bacterium]|nr:alpha/beta hydrolase [Lachnospiraceae bacterium]